MNTTASIRRFQDGAAAVEFAFVFPFLFLLMYGVVVYAYTFVLQESINFAAQEAGEAAVAVDPSPDTAGRDALRKSRAQLSAAAVLNWLPDAQKQRVIGSNGSQVDVNICPMGGSFGSVACPTDTDAVVITLRFNMTSPNDLFPVLDMPLIGKVPPLPTQLTGQAVVRV